MQCYCLYLFTQKLGHFNELAYSTLFVKEITVPWPDTGTAGLSHGDQLFWLELLTVAEAGSWTQAYCAVCTRPPFSSLYLSLSPSISFSPPVSQSLYIYLVLSPSLSVSICLSRNLPISLSLYLSVYNISLSFSPPVSQSASFSSHVYEGGLIWKPRLGHMCIRLGWFENQGWVTCVLGWDDLKTKAGSYVR